MKAIEREITVTVEKWDTHEWSVHRSQRVIAKITEKRVKANGRVFDRLRGYEITSFRSPWYRSSIDPMEVA